MDITSITSSVGAYTSTPTQSSSLQQAQQAAQTKPVEQREPQATESKEQAPRPVTNTLGQETGKLISVTA